MADSRGRDRRRQQIESGQIESGQGVDEPSGEWHLPAMRDSLSEAAVDLQGRVDQLAQVLDDYEGHAKDEATRSAAALVEHAIASRDARIDEARRAAVAAASQLSAFDQRLRALDDRLGALPDTGTLVRRVNQRMAAALEPRDRKLGEAQGAVESVAERINGLADELRALQARTTQPRPTDAPAVTSQQLDAVRSALATTVQRLESLDERVEALAQRPDPAPAPPGEAPAPTAPAPAAPAAAAADTDLQLRRTNAIITDALRARDQRIRMMANALERADERFRELDQRLRTVTSDLGRTGEEVRTVDQRLQALDESQVRSSGEPTGGSPRSTPTAATEQLVRRLQETVARLERNSGRLDALDERVGGLDQRVRAVPAADVLLNRVKATISEALGARDDRVEITDAGGPKADDRFRPLEERLGSVGTQMERVDTTLSAIDRRLNDLGRRIEARPDAGSVVRLTTEAIGDVLRARNAALDDLRSALSTTSERLDALDGRAATADRRFAALAQRLAASTSEEAQQGRTRTTVDAALTTRDERIKELATALVAATRRLEAVEHRLTRPDSDISTVRRRTDEAITGATAPLTARVDELSQRVATFEQRETALRRALRESRSVPGAAGATPGPAAGEVDSDAVRGRLEQMVAARDTQLEELRRAASSLDQRMKALDTRVAAGTSSEAVDGMQRAVAALADRLDTMSGRLDSTGSDVSGADERLAAIQSELATLRQGFETIRSGVDDVGQRIEALPNASELVAEALAPRDAQLDDLRVSLVGTRQELAVVAEQLDQEPPEEEIDLEETVAAVVTAALEQSDAKFRETRRTVDATTPRLDALDERMSQLVETVIASANATVTDALTTREAHFEKMRSAISATAEWLKQIDRRIGALPDVDAAVSSALSDRDARFDRLTATVAEALANRDVQVQSLMDEVKATRSRLDDVAAGFLEVDVEGRT